MRRLEDLILRYAQEHAEAGRWDDVAARLNAQSIVKRTGVRLTYKLIREKFGDVSRRKVAETLYNHQDFDIRDAHNVMLNESVGLDISTDERQALLQGLGQLAGWDPLLITGLKEVGVKHLSPAQAAGESPVTAEECRESWEQYKFELQFAGLRETILDPAVSQGKSAAIQALQTLISQLGS